MAKPDKAVTQQCPLGPLSELLKDCVRYYVPPSLGGGRPDGAWREKAVRRLGSDENSVIDFNGATWTHLRHISVRLDLAADDHRSGHPKDEKLTHLPTHRHGWFKLDQRSVHVDFVRFVSYDGPEGIADVLVFVDGVLRERGGNFFCKWARLPRTWPIAIPLGDQLLLLDKMPFEGPDLPAFDGISLWKREDQKNGVER